MEGLSDHLEDNVTLYADLPNMRASGNPLATIPESILITTACPDIVLVEDDEVILLELTIPHNSTESISSARARKSTNNTLIVEASYSFSVCDTIMTHRWNCRVSMECWTMRGEVCVCVSVSILCPCISRCLQMQGTRSLYSFHTVE